MHKPINLCHCVQVDKSIPVKALQTLMAVRTSTEGSDPGLAPSKDGDQGPPMANVSFFPRVPTKN